LSAASDE
jgi:hypothetical protein